MYLYANGFHVIFVERVLGELRQVELHLAPSFCQAHRHGAHVRAYPRCRLIITHAKTAPEVVAVQNLYTGQYMQYYHNTRRNDRQQQV